MTTEVSFLRPSVQSVNDVRKTKKLPLTVAIVNILFYFITNAAAFLITGFL